MRPAWFVAVLAVSVQIGMVTSQASTPSSATSVSSAERVYVMANSGVLMPRVRPTSMHLLSNENLGKLKWSSWGRSTAYGHGTDYANGPSPGHSSQNPITVRLYGIKTCGSRRLYTKLKVTFTKGRPYSGSPRTEKFPFGCP